MTGTLPNLPKYVLIAAPHTSAWDVWWGVHLKFAYQIDAHFLAKAELFDTWIGRWFFGGVMRARPVKRTEREDTVAQVKAMFDANERFVLCLAPEGTRAFTPKFRTGFYHIAMAANVPVVGVAMDFEKKSFEIAEPYTLSGDLEKDMEHLSRHFIGVKGAYPELGTFTFYEKK